ncbi:matrilin-4-like [Mercenaria mercenaria]|uniref:matrilin-4-like n=1 Tax=Mercenaria mercenaria TaxID=6596 RepID=UPI00234E550B|nr:matrilin-4-like [Mercenaria mercenaria]XP_053375055.1 matrilin-4-like [Mercenaria mercenaria]XP_053375056.1 matrilin-4-like [Mercenaria mercenaria]
MLFTLTCTLLGLLPFVSGQCPGKADIVFAVPASELIPGQEFFPFERFLINLVSYFRLDRENVNIGLILYGKTPIPISWPQPFKSAKQINTRITLMSQRLNYIDLLNGGNDVASAIKMMRHMFRDPTGHPMPKPRDGVKKIGVIFTYSSVPENERQEVITAAEELKSDGVVVYAVGKGKAGPEFAAIGSDYCKSFSMGRFIDGLPSVLAFLGSSICSEMDPNVNVSALNCFPQLYQRKEPEPIKCSSKSILFPDPENCAYFYHCLFRRPVQEPCPIGMLFDPIAQSCNYKEFVSCYSDIDCPKKNGLFPHPSDCSKYVNCFDFRPYIQSCPFGLWFDEKTGGCESAGKVACRMY